jgi:hypothetical protein
MIGLLATGPVNANRSPLRFSPVPCRFVITLKQGPSPIASPSRIAIYTTPQKSFPWVTKPDGR